MRIRISRTWLALTARNSAVPFLYQTRTLATTLPGAIHSKTYSTSSPPEQSPATLNPDEDPSREQDHSTETKAEDAPQQPQRHRKSYIQRRAASLKQHDLPAQPHSRPLQRPLSGQRPNMTRSEKQAFSELLEQMGVDPVAPGKDASGEETVGLNQTLNEADRHEMAQVSAIFDSVLKDMKKKRTWGGEKQASQTETEDDALDMDLEVESTPREREAPLNRESPVTSSRSTTNSETIYRAPTYSNEEVTELLRTNQLSVERAIEHVKQREARRIKAALHEAVDKHTGDTGIWEVCKTQIFSMLQEEQHPSPEESQSATSTSTTSTHTQLVVPDGVPRTAVVVTLYPQMLLVAFRLLNLHYSGSPLIAQFRATIKSQGRASAVLGSSTGLYNELIYFYWRGCLDLPGVVSLLHEMEVTGVDADGRTCAQLEGISHQRDRDLREHRLRVRAGDATGPREPWWDLAPNRRAMKELFGPGGWMGRLEGRMKERKRRERMYTDHS